MLHRVFNVICSRETHIEYTEQYIFYFLTFSLGCNIFWHTHVRHLEIREKKKNVLPKCFDLDKKKVYVYYCIMYIDRCFKYIFIH